MSSLTLAQASTILDVALKTGREAKFAPLSVAVLDAGSHLAAFKREDKSGILRFEIAFGKAWGALGMGFGSCTLAGRVSRSQMFFTAPAGRERGPVRAGDRRRSGPGWGRRHHRRGRHFRRYVRQ